MERKSFLAKGPSSSVKAGPACFQDIDLHVQPSLTKRGRTGKQIVKRVFVILDGYLFYFHDASAAEPCGVIPLANSEYVVHSYASTDQTDNYCFELRSPARSWGTVILHYHNVLPTKATDIERTLGVAGSRRRRRHSQQGSPQKNQQASQRNAGSASAGGGRSEKLSRLITLSGISGMTLWPRRANSSRRQPECWDSERRSFLDEPQSEQMQFEDGVEASERKTFIAKIKSGRHNSLLKIHWTMSPAPDNSEDAATAIVNSPSTRRHSTLSFSCHSSWASRSSFSQQQDFVAESDIAVEHCHELCVSGFVENATRKLFHFISAHWTWEKLCRRRNSHMSIVLDGSDHQPRIRFASAFTTPSAGTGRGQAATANIRHLSLISTASSSLVGRGSMPSAMPTRPRGKSLPLLLLTDGSATTSASFLTTTAFASLHARTSEQVLGNLTTASFKMARPPSPSSRPPALLLLQDKAHFDSAANSAIAVPVTPMTTKTVVPAPPSMSPMKPAPSLPSSDARSSLFSSFKLALNTQHSVAPSTILPKHTTSQGKDMTVSTNSNCTPSPASSCQPNEPTAPLPSSASSKAAPRSPPRSPRHSPPKSNSPHKSAASRPALGATVNTLPPTPHSQRTQDIRIVQAISVAESYSGGYLLKQYEPLKVIGTGGFGQVMVARHKASGQLVAIKSLSKRAIAMHHQVEHSLSEKAVLTMCQHHPFIIQLHAAFQTIDHLHLVLDYCPGGELFFHLSQRGRFQENQAAFYMAEVVLALEHLHRHNIIYRDLKPENVLLDKDGHVRLADFGLSKLGVDEQTLATTFCGSIEYLAPEVLAVGDKYLGEQLPTPLSPTSRRGYGRAADFWALGCLLFELLTGEPPFYSGNNRPKLYERIMEASLTFPAYMSADAVDLIRALLATDPYARLGNDGRCVRDHRFFAKHVDWDQVRARKAQPPVQPRAEAFANFDQYFTSMPVRQVDKMVQFPAKIPMDYQLFENFNWEPSSPH